MAYKTADILTFLLWVLEQFYGVSFYTTEDLILVSKTCTFKTMNNLKPSYIFLWFHQLINVISVGSCRSWRPYNSGGGICPLEWLSFVMSVFWSLIVHFPLYYLSELTSGIGICIKIFCVKDFRGGKGIILIGLGFQNECELWKLLHHLGNCMW